MPVNRLEMLLADTRICVLSYPDPFLFLLFCPKGDSIPFLPRDTSGQMTATSATNPNQIKSVPSVTHPLVLISSFKTSSSLLLFMSCNGSATLLVLLLSLFLPLGDDNEIF